MAPLSELGQCPGEDVPGIEQEDIGLSLADVIDECGHLGNAPNQVLVLEPEGRDWVVGAFHIVGEEQGDGGGVMLDSLD